MKNLILYSALLATISWPVSADSLYLRDGRVVRGVFMGGSSRDIRFSEDGGREQSFPLSSVDNVVFGNGNGNASAYRNGYGDRNANPTADRNDRAYRDDQYRTRNSNTNVSGDQIPSGTVLTVRLIDPIDSDRTSDGRSYRATLDDPIVVNGRTIADRGADATVRVARVQQSGRITGQEEIELVLSELRMNGRMYAVSTGPATIAEKSKGSQSAKVIGGTAVVGAIIGAIAGGGRGAAIGAASGAGAGAAVQAIRGQRIQVPSESNLDFTLNQPIYLNQ